MLPLFPAAPPALADLIYCSHVQLHIRKYNSALSMASVGHKSKGLTWGAFVLGGRTYHRIGSVLPDVGSPHCFAQIYILDVSAATDRRLGIFGGASSSLRRDVLARLHERLSDHNPLIQQFVAVARGDAPHVVWKCSDDISSMQLGALVADAGSRRDIVVQRAHGPVVSIHDGHGLYHPLAYPLLFPLGTAGWNEDMVVVNPEGPHLTAHSSHLTPHTSHLTPHTSHPTAHSSLLTVHTPQLTAHSSLLTAHSSQLTVYISDI